MLLIPVVTVVIVVCAERENERSESALHSLFGSLSERDLVIEACSFSSPAKPIKSFLVRIPEHERPRNHSACRIFHLSRVIV